MRWQPAIATRSGWPEVTGGLVFPWLDVMVHGPLGVVLAHLGAGGRRAQRLRRQFRADFSEMAARVDVVMTPAMPSPAPRDLNTTGDAAFQAPWSVSGLPTVVVSTGLSELGMPMAVQFGWPVAPDGQVVGETGLGEEALLVRDIDPDQATRAMFLYDLEGCAPVLFGDQGRREEFAHVLEPAG